MEVEVNDDALEIEHVFRATVEKVYECFTRADIAREWMSPGEIRCTELDMDVQPGGSYRLTMESPEDKKFIAAGQYTDVVPNQRLAYTWQWQDGDSPVTEVEITFEEIDDGCRVVFRHSGFITPEAARSHSEGWTSILEKLDALLAG